MVYRRNSRTEAAVEMRFLDEEPASNVDVSRNFNVAAVISAPGCRRRHAFKFVQLRRRLADSVDAEFGPRASTVDRSEWLYGVVCGFGRYQQQC